jgi:predicted nucleic acid-binding protein
MLIDTNILVYAINADSLKNKTAQQFLQKYNEKLVIAHQNIFEALRVLTHPKFSNPMKLKDAYIAIWSIVEACTIITPNNKTHYIAMELINENNLIGNRVFDAYLAATALSNDVITIVTDNTKDFQILRLKIINPFKLN